MPVRPKVQPSPPPSPFVDSHGAAQFLCVAEQTIANWRLRGGGPPFSKIGAKILYDIADLVRFVAERKVKSTSEITYTGRRRGRPPRPGAAQPPERAEAAEKQSPTQNIA